jgi:hypothetical protein
VDVRPQKKARRDPEALEDTYATWTPVNDDGLTEAHTFADAVSSYDVVVDDDEGSKRKRYKNSVPNFIYFAVCALLTRVGHRMSPCRVGVRSSRSSSMHCCDDLVSGIICRRRRAPAAVRALPMAPVFFDARSAGSSCSAANA